MPGLNTTPEYIEWLDLCSDAAQRYSPETYFRWLKLCRTCPYTDFDQRQRAVWAHGFIQRETNKETYEQRTTTED